MLAAQRKDLILTTLRDQGRVVAKDLAAELDLSEDTIRRDLRELAADGCCTACTAARSRPRPPSPTSPRGP